MVNEHRKSSQAWFINNLGLTWKIRPFLGLLFFCFFSSYQNSFPCCLGNRPRERDVGSRMTWVQASVVPSFHTGGRSRARWVWQAVNHGRMGHVPVARGLRGETDG